MESAGYGTEGGVLAGLGRHGPWKTAASMGKSQLGRWGLYRAVEERLFQSRVKAYITICPSGPVELKLASHESTGLRGHEMAALPRSGGRPMLTLTRACFKHDLIRAA